MICAKCGKSALGITMAGIPACHVCVNWKDELQAYRDSKPRDAKGWPK